MTQSFRFQLSNKGSERYLAIKIDMIREGRTVFTVKVFCAFTVLNNSQSPPILTQGDHGRDENSRKYVAGIGWTRK